MNLAALSAIYPGYVKGQEALATLAEQKERQDAYKRQMLAEGAAATAAAAPDQAGLAGLSNAPPPPQVAPPQGPGQASVPAQGAAPIPPVSGPPPQGAFPPGVSPSPQGGPPPQGAAAPGQPARPQSAPPVAAPSQPARPAPPAGAPAAAGSPAPDAKGQAENELHKVTMDIVRANPQINFKTPEGAAMLFKAIEASQKIHAPEQKEALAVLKQTLEQTKAQQKFEAEMSKQREDYMKAVMTATNRAEMAEANERFKSQQLENKERFDALQKDLERQFKGSEGDKNRDLKGSEGDKNRGIKKDLAEAGNALKKELGEAKNLNDTKKIEGTQWYRERLTELKAQGLADAAAKAQADHEVKLIQEDGRNTRSTATLAERGQEGEANRASRERIASGAQELKRELGEGALKLGADKLQQTQWYQKRQTELRQLGLEDSAVKVQLDHEVKLLQEQGRNDRSELTLSERGREADQSEAGRNSRAQQSDATKRELAGMSAETRKYVADLQSGTRKDLAGMSDKTKRELAGASDETKRYVAGLHDATTRRGQDLATDRSTSSLGERAREFDISDATKRAQTEARLKAVTEKAKSGDISDEEAEFYAKGLKSDPAMVLRLMGAGGVGTAAKQHIARVFAENPENLPDDIAKAGVILSGKKAGMQTAERQGAKVDIGAEEIKSFGPKVVEAAKAGNFSKYPTLSALQQAVTRGTGDAKATALNDAITNYRNALIQVAQRGGATSEGAQARADQYINPRMSLAQILAAVRSGKAEAEIAQGAVRTVTGKIADSVGQPTGGGSMKADAKNVAALRQGDPEAYKAARRKFLDRYGSVGGADALEEAVKSAGSAKPAGAPEVGTVEDGHRFKGGDPSKPESWEAVP